MIIKEIQGNLLDFPENINVIAHSCNCQNTMGAGIAKEIKVRYPNVYEADSSMYRTFKENGFSHLGKASLIEVGENKRVANCYTQDHYGRNGRYVDYEAFYNAFKWLESNLKSTDTLGVPKYISCKNAGGSWRIIEAILSDIFLTSQVQLVIVER